MDSKFDVVEEDPEADTKEEAQDAGRHVIEADPEADTNKVNVTNTDTAGCDEVGIRTTTSSAFSNEKESKRIDDYSKNVSVKFGVPSSGPEIDNSFADTSIVVEEDPEADTLELAGTGEVASVPTARDVGQVQPPVQGGTDVHKVVFSYSPFTPKRLKHFYPMGKVIADGVMVFGRLAPLGGVQVKLNDSTISKRQFSLTLVHESNQSYFVFKNLSNSKTILLNGETLGLDESRRLPLISRMHILDLNRAYGEGQSMNFLLCVEMSNRSRSYTFEVTFKCDSTLLTNFAMNTPAPQMNVSQPLPGIVIGDGQLGSAVPYPVSASPSLDFVLLGDAPVGVEQQVPASLSAPDGEHGSTSSLPVQASASPNVSPQAGRKSFDDDVFEQ